MRSPFRRRHTDTSDARTGVSLAKGPALLVGSVLLAYGLTGLLTNSTFPDFSAAFPDGTAQGESWLGPEVNGWTNWLCIAAGGLLLFGAAQHLLAKTMSLVVGLALAAATVIAVIDGEDVLGLAAANGWTKLGLGIAAAVLLVNVLMPRTKGKRDHELHAHRDHDAHVHHDRDVRTTRDEPATTVLPEQEHAGAQRTGRFTRDPEAIEPERQRQVVGLGDEPERGGPERPPRV
ncbi:DUF4383 domain-containing protein [Conexibacter sp. SYSU D00693]|uniref:DUF4383 domain-containing protein n=1 Tax=Conexibacter sp. SYSU D00693 TaxID=2812560 RepID=UPI00196B1156|nr:DUF4383 domain-containing protein [Conexibacter sp. SYSU D00693]